MNWLPQPRDFKEQLRAAISLAAGSERLARLAALAQSRLGFVEEIQLDKALREAVTGEARGFPALRVAVLSACTVDHLAPALRVAALRRGLLAQVLTGGFAQYRHELLDPGSALASFRPEFIVLSLTAREILNSVPLGAKGTQVEQAIAGAVAELKELWRRARERFGATVVQQTFLDVSQPVFGSFDRLVPAAPRRLVMLLNEQVADAAAASGALLLDVAGAAARDGLDAWFDVRHWLQGKMEVAPAAASRYGELLARVLAAQRGRSRKCLVLDLDNTLWGGVVGDDGVEGLVLGEGSARGEAHLALQKYARLLKERGIILAVCSKNDPRIAESAFREHPEMALHRTDIAAFVSFTDDDRQRAQQYAANAEREALRQETGNLDDFLRGLGMSLVAGPVQAVDAARVVQLINKTNQFNTTTRRMTAEEFDRFVGQKGSVALQFRLRDRFGDNGLVSVMLLAHASDDPATARIENWVMSCRVFGRQLEDEALNVAVEAALANGYRTLAAEFIPTAKNGVVSDLYERLGLNCVRRGGDGRSQWRLDLAAYRPRQTSIARAQPGD
jgi:HAD superfamily phosphatase (TIGR01681 family)